MCLNSQIDAVRPLHFYRAMGNRFQSTQTVVVVVVLVVVIVVIVVVVVVIHFRWSLELIDFVLQFKNQAKSK